MRTQLQFLIAILVLISCLTLTAVDAKSSDSSKQKNLGFRSVGPTRARNLSKKLNLMDAYNGLVIIPSSNGTYYTGYGEQCPSGCAIEGRCGTSQECLDSDSEKISFGENLLITIVFVAIILTIAYFVCTDPQAIAACCCYCLCNLLHSDD